MLLSCLVADCKSVAQRKAAGGGWVPFKLFGTVLDPRSMITWAIPILLLTAGALLLVPVMRITQRAWLKATTAEGEHAPAGAPAASASAVPGGGA